MDEKIFFKVRINIPDLDQHDPDAQRSELEHEAELVFEINEDSTGGNFSDIWSNQN